MRTDLPVPVIRAQTETDMGSVASGFGVLALNARQSDTDRFRYYEMAGTAHNVVHKNIDVAGTGLTLEDFCLDPINSFADGPVVGSYLYSAMWEALERHVTERELMPQAEKLVVVNGEISRDAHGRAGAFGCLNSTCRSRPTRRATPSTPHCLDSCSRSAGSCAASPAQCSRSTLRA